MKNNPCTFSEITSFTISRPVAISDSETWRRISAVPTNNSRMFLRRFPPPRAKSQDSNPDTDQAVIGPHEIPICEEPQTRASITSANADRRDLDGTGIRLWPLMKAFTSKARSRAYDEK